MRDDDVRSARLRGLGALLEPLGRESLEEGAVAPRRGWEVEVGVAGRDETLVLYLDDDLRARALVERERAEEGPDADRHTLTPEGGEWPPGPAAAGALVRLRAVARSFLLGEAHAVHAPFLRRRLEDAASGDEAAWTRFEADRLAALLGWLREEAERDPARAARLFGEGVREAAWVADPGDPALRALLPGGAWRLVIEDRARGRALVLHVDGALRVRALHEVLRATPERDAGGR